MQNPAQASPAVSTQAPRQAVLHLRGATREEEVVQEGERRGITWAEDVVDNEGLGRKSSKGLSCPWSSSLCLKLYWVVEWGLRRAFGGFGLMVHSLLHIPCAERIRRVE